MLARKHHPDVSQTGDDSTQDFARIVEAYEILKSPKRRAMYDMQLLTGSLNGNGNGNGESVMNSANLHAQKLRRMTLEHRYNKIVDAMFDAERRETFARQKVIFPVVGLFVTTFIVAFIKPALWPAAGMPGKIILVTLFTVAVLHLYRRLKAGFERFTHDEEAVHESILGESNKPEPAGYPRFTATAFLLCGLALSFFLGLAAASIVLPSPTDFFQPVFSDSIRPEAVFYPPIVALLVDVMHTIALKIEG
jgi:hypothetical protein